MPFPLEVGLSGPLAPLATAAAESITAGLQARTAALLATLGLPAEASVTVAESGGPSMVSLRADGAPCRFPELQPALVDAALHGRWADPTTVHEWVDSAKSWEEQAEVVVAVCEQALILNPSLLVSGEATRAVASRVAAHDPGLAAELTDLDALEDILRRVVGLRIGVADTARVAALLREGEGGTAAARAELLVAALARDTVGVLVPDDVGELLGTGDPQDSEDLLGFVAEGLTTETGIVLPRLVLEPASGLPDGTFAIRINDLPTAPVRLLPSDTALVNDTAAALSSFTEVLATTTNPATGQPGALVPSEACEKLEPLGYTTWRTAQHVCLQLAAELRRHMGAVVSQDRVQAQLDVLEDAAPMLIRSARAELELAELTGLVRRLAADHVPLTHLPFMLERVIDLPADDLGAQRYALLSDPVLAPSWQPERRAPEYDAREAFVRAGLRTQITARVKRGDVIPVYLLDSELEASLSCADRTHAQEDRVLAAIRAELTYAHLSAYPAVLTTTWARASLGELLRVTLPTMVVLATDDLPADAVVQPVARIAAT